MNSDEPIAWPSPVESGAALAGAACSISECAAPATAADARSAGLMLVVVTLFWGLSFPLVKDWQDLGRDCRVGGFSKPAGAEQSHPPAGLENRPTGPGAVVVGTTLIALRVLLALPLLLLFRPALLHEPTAGEHVAGLVIGLVFVAGFMFQVVGMAWTSPALSGFLTSVGCAWVPLLGWAFLRDAVPRLTMLGIALGVGGAMILAGIDRDLGGSTIGWGELLTLIASVFFAVQILLLDRLGKRSRPGTLTAAFFAVTGLGALGVTLFAAARTFGVAAWAGWLTAMLQTPRVVIDLLMMTLLSTVLAFYWMNIYQPRISASRASLIYLLEPVFAGGFSVLLGFDAITWRLLLGGSIILGGNLLVELPAWLRERQRGG